MKQLRKLFDNMKTDYKRQCTRQKRETILNGIGVITGIYQADTFKELLLDTAAVEMNSTMDSHTVLLTEKSEIACSPRNTEQAYILPDVEEKELLIQRVSN